MFGADTALEQQRHRRVPDPLVDIVGGHQRDRTAASSQAADDDGKDVRQFRADQQEPFAVGLGWGDLQQGHDFAGAREPVFGDAVVGQLQELLVADAGQA